MNETKRILRASGLSIPVQQSNAPYLSITMRMFSTRPNRNGDGVTERFIDSIIEHQASHVGLPLYADKLRLCNRDFGNLGHQYDPLSGEFHTEEIGSFCGFERVEDEYGISQFGEARVYKRSQAVCGAILELYSRQMLNVSFEISYDTLLIMDGVEYIDASANNVITGMAIVSCPAYPEAVATRLVAEEARSEEGSEPPVADETEPKESAPEELEPEKPEPKDNDVEQAAHAAQEHTDEEKEGVNDMTLDEAKNKIADLEREVQELTRQQNEKPVEEKPEEDAPTMPVADHEAAVNVKDEEITTLTQQVNELAAVKDELDTLKQAQADAEREQKLEALKTFAQAHGLDVEAEAIAAAIEAMDYPALIAAANEKTEPGTKAAARRPMADISVGDPYGGILSKTDQ